jgi:hypothetical protein
VTTTHHVFRRHRPIKWHGFCNLFAAILKTVRHSSCLNSNVHTLQQDLNPHLRLAKWTCCANLGIPILHPFSGIWYMVSCTGFDLQVILNDCPYLLVCHFRPTYFRIAKDQSIQKYWDYKFNFLLRIDGHSSCSVNGLNEILYQGTTL